MENLRNDNKAGFLIRPVDMKDAPDIHELRVMPGVYESLLALPSERLEAVEEFLKSSHDPSIVAEVNGRVVAMACIEISDRPRRRHCAALGIMVHKDFQGKGIGHALLKALLNIADNWLMLKRLELSVFTDNDAAVNLYKSFGFVIEGTQRYGAIKDGEYADLFLMARYKN